MNRYEVADNFSSEGVFFQRVEEDKYLITDTYLMIIVDKEEFRYIKSDLYFNPFGNKQYVGELEVGEKVCTKKDAVVYPKMEERMEEILSEDLIDITVTDITKGTRRLYYTDNFIGVADKDYFDLFNLPTYKTFGKGNPIVVYEQGHGLRGFIMPMYLGELENELEKIIKIRSGE